jgi:hypothetical protein
VPANHTETEPIKTLIAKALPGPPSKTACVRCHELHVRTLTTAVRMYHYCHHCLHSWNVTNQKARSRVRQASVSEAIEVLGAA